MIIYGPSSKENVPTYRNDDDLMSVFKSYKELFDQDKSSRVKKVVRESRAEFAKYCKKN